MNWTQHYGLIAENAFASIMRNNWKSKKFMKETDTYKIRGMRGSGEHRKNVSSFLLRIILNACRII